MNYFLSKDANVLRLERGETKEETLELLCPFNEDEMICCGSWCALFAFKLRDGDGITSLPGGVAVRQNCGGNPETIFIPKENILE